MTYTEDTSPLPDLPDRLRISAGSRFWRYDDNGKQVIRTVDRAIVVYGLYISNRRPRLYTFVYDGWPWFIQARQVEVI